MNNKFNNPWNNVAGFTDLGSFTDSHGEYYELYCFPQINEMAIGARFGEDGDYISGSLTLKTNVLYSGSESIIEAVKRMYQRGIVKGDIINHNKKVIIKG